MSAPAADLAADPPVDPEPSSGPRRGRRLRRVLWVGLTAIVLVAGLLAGAYVVIARRFEAAVTRATLLQPEARAPEPVQAHGISLSGPLNFLMLGSDYRIDDPENGQRSDTIIVAHVARNMDRVYLLSIPRDLLVRIPPRPELNFWGDYTKVNAAFQYGHGGESGAQLVAATLTDLMDIRFDGAAVVDFTGLMKVVSVLGVITMCLDEPVISIHTYRGFPAGCQKMDADLALDYIRQRNFADGDFERQRHQQQFLKAVLDEVVKARMLTNPVKLDALLQALAGSMVVDLGSMGITDLAMAFSGLRTEDLIGLRVPYYLTMIGETSFVVASDEADDLWKALRDDTLDVWAANHPDWVNKI